MPDGIDARPASQAIAERPAMTHVDLTVDPRPYPANPDYTVHPDGRIFSRFAGRFLVGSWDGHYFSITIRIDGKQRRKRIGVIVLETFVGPRPPGLICRHKDGDSENNHIGNLEWSTQLQNMRDTYAHGTRIRGEKTGNAKLTEADVRIIRTMTCLAAAREFGISRAQSSRIINGKMWTHVR
jgi:hypothetical protein